MNTNYSKLYNTLQMIKSENEAIRGYEERINCWKEAYDRDLSHLAETNDDFYNKLMQQDLNRIVALNQEKAEVEANRNRLIESVID